KTRQRFGGRLCCGRNSVSDFCIFGGFDGRSYVADLTRGQFRQRNRMWRITTEFRDFELSSGGHKADLVAFTQLTIDNAEHHHGSAVTIVPAIEHQSAQRSFWITLGRRDPFDHSLKKVQDS